MALLNNDALTFCVYFLSGQFVRIIDTKDVSWQLLVARAFVMLFAGGVAGYTATQSSEHRRKHSELAPAGCSST